MSSSRQLRLGAFMWPVSIHTAAWRYPGAFPDANLNFEHLTRFAQTLERGKFDAFFMADHLAVLNMPVQALKRSATVTSFHPLTLLPALTKRLGLIATASTTYNEPYHVARKFASLDHISQQIEDRRCSFKCVLEFLFVCHWTSFARFDVPGSPIMPLADALEPQR